MTRKLLSHQNKLMLHTREGGFQFVLKGGDLGGRGVGGGGCDYSPRCHWW